MGLGFQDWFLTEDQCDALLKHWEDRATWLNQPADYDHTEKSELWHGKRWQQLDYFWDPDQETLLPEKCPTCGLVICASQIASAKSGPDAFSMVTCVCTHYSSEVTVAPRYMKGDPCNQAILMWFDGWAPHSTSSKHSVAAIVVSHACMAKVERADCKSARVYLFIPVSQLPRDSPHKYDAFLQPLVEDLMDLYIEGQEV